MDVDALQAVEVEHLGRLDLRRLAAALTSACRRSGAIVTPQAREPRPVDRHHTRSAGVIRKPEGVTGVASRPGGRDLPVRVTERSRADAGATGEGGPWDRLPWRAV
jgi:hypothetical protein